MANESSLESPFEAADAPPPLNSDRFFITCVLDVRSFKEDDGCNVRRLMIPKALLCVCVGVFNNGKDNDECVECVDLAEMAVMVEVSNNSDSHIGTNM